MPNHRWLPAAALVALAAAALPALAAQRGHPAPPPAPAVVAEGVAPEAQAHPNPPADLPRAQQVAREFALALFAADLPRLRQLTTDRYAAQLLAPSAGGRPARGADHVSIDGITAQDLQPNVVLLHVIVRWGITGRPDHLDLMNVRVVRTPAGWRVDDSSV